MRQYGRRKAGALAPEIPSLVFRISNISEEVQFLEGFPGTFRNSAQRVFRNVDGQSRLFMQELVQTAQQSASSSQNNPPVHKVGGQFRGQRSKVVRTASTIVLSCSVRASRTSSDRIVTVLGRPATRSRPLTSIESS